MSGIWIDVALLVLLIVHKTLCVKTAIFIVASKAQDGACLLVIMFSEYLVIKYVIISTIRYACPGKNKRNYNLLDAQQVCMVSSFN